MRGDIFFVAVLLFGVCTTSQAERPAAPEQTCYWVGDSVEAEEAIREKLAQQLDSAGLDFLETSLEEILLGYLTEAYGLNIHIDKIGLHNLGIETRTKVSVNLRNVSVKTALIKLLEQLELTYYIENELLVITSQEVAHSRLSIAVYPVGDLVWTEKSKYLLYDELIDTIVQSIATETWAENGGCEAEISPCWGLLIITQTEDVHGEIKNFFETLRLCDKYRIDDPDKMVESRFHSSSESGGGISGAFSFGGFGASASAGSSKASK